MSARPLVLGAAIGYRAEQLAPFIASLRKAGYDGDVALLVDRARVSEFARLPLFRGVTLLPATQWLPLRFGLLRHRRWQRWLWHPLQAALWLAMRLLAAVPLPSGVRADLQAALGERLYPPTESRFLRFRAFLRRYPSGRVLISDVRDVLFQNDPFAALPQSGLAVGIEVRSYTIATEKWNRDRVREIYGEQVLADIGARPVSCSGVTCGDRASMLTYLELMAQEICALSRHMARRGWFDQALHNVVLWQRWRGELHALETLSSPLATLGALRDASLKLDSGGRLLNADGSAPSILHQYDRLKALAPALLEGLAAIGPAGSILSIRPQ